MAPQIFIWPAHLNFQAR